MTRVVTMKDHKPLVIKKDEMTEDVWICRCGLSAEWPYCDGTHKQTFKEDQGKLYGYQRATAQDSPVRTEVTDPLGPCDPRPWVEDQK